MEFTYARKKSKLIARLHEVEATSGWTTAMVSVEDRAQTDEKGVTVQATYTVENEAMFRRSDTEVLVTELSIIQQQLLEMIGRMSHDME